MPKIYGYTRVSSQDQFDSGYGLLAQERTLKAYMKYMSTVNPDMEVGSIFCEPKGVSAAKVPFLQRPTGGEVLKTLKPGDHIAFAKHNRAFRNVKDLVTTKPVFDLRDITIHFCDLGIDLSTKEGKLIITVMISVAEWEASAISERTKEALAERKAKGLSANGHTARNGYKLLANGQEVRDKEKIAIGRYINYLYHHVGMSRTVIGDRLEEIIAKRKGIKPRPRHGFGDKQRDYHISAIAEIIRCWDNENKKFMSQFEAKQKRSKKAS